MLNVSRNCDGVWHHRTNKPSNSLVRLGDSGIKLRHDKDPTLSPAHGHCHFLTPDHTLNFHQRALVDELRAFRINGKGLSDALQSEEWYPLVLRLRREIERDEGSV